MPRYLIEIRHTDEHDGCVRALDAIVNHGSHLITAAEFGCEDGIHKGWLMVDVDTHEEAQRLVPPQYRNDADVVQLRKWTREQIREMRDELDD